MGVDLKIQNERRYIVLLLRTLCFALCFPYGKNHCLYNVSQFRSVEDVAKHGHHLGEPLLARRNRGRNIYTLLDLDESLVTPCPLSAPLRKEGSNWEEDAENLEEVVDHSMSQRNGRISSSSSSPPSQEALQDRHVTSNTEMDLGDDGGYYIL